MDPRIAPTSTAPLAGILVLDLTRHYASPYCSLLLAELGAQVIKLPSLEPGSEGVMRIAAALTRHSQALEADAGRGDGQWLKPSDGDGFEALLARADVLLENQPGLMAQLGHDWADIHRLYPRLILASISEFAHAKTLRWPAGVNGGVDTASARKGSGHTEGGSPAQAGTSVEDLAAGMSSALAIQAALISQVRTGLGSHVDSTVLSRQVTLLAAALSGQSRVSDRLGPEGATTARAHGPQSGVRSPSMW